MDNQLANLQYFTRLAKRGRHRGASGGEKRAFRLAQAVLDGVVVLDDRALNGFVEFIRGAKMAPETARELVDIWEPAHQS